MMMDELLIIKTKLINKIMDVVNLLYRQEYLNSSQNMTELIDYVNELMIYCENTKDNMIYNGQCSIDIDLLNILKKLLLLQETRDYLVLADTLEYEMLPVIFCIQSMCVEDKIIYEQNEYKIEKTDLGVNTLAVKCGGEWNYLHSTRDPYKEAKCLAERWFDKDYYDYIVVGLGLGYHIQAMLDVEETVSVIVLEEDNSVVDFARKYGVLNKLEQSGRVKLVTYDNFYQLSSLGAFNDDKKRIVIHYPSIKKIRDKILKNQLENYFIIDNSYEMYKVKMIGNFLKNRQEFKHEVTELVGKFIGKNVFIVAAGPSLDKNLSLLKNKPEESVIFATGTVLKKMLEMDIVPDYVIITDAGATTYIQTEGLERGDIPLLYLSTVYYKIPHNYLGQKFFICQKGFQKVEKYAQDNGYPLYETGGSVTTTALEISICMKCRRVIFIGLDLAYTSGRTHASNTADENVRQQSEMSVLDVHGRMVYTAKNLNIYRKWIEKRIQSVDAKKIQFIDATEGGALIKGTLLQRLEDVINEIERENVQ